MAQHPRLMRLSALIAHLMLRPFASNGFIKWLPPPFNAWTKTRDFPLPRRKPTPIASKEVALR
jgi:hypothetical protein